MAAFEDREIAEDHVAAVLESDRLVAYTSLLGFVDWVVAAGRVGVSEAETLAVDEARAGDANVVNVFAPEQRVVPVVVSVVLVGVPRSVGFSCVVGAAVVAGGRVLKRRVRGENGRTLRQMERDVALQSNGEAEPRAGGKQDRATTGGCCGFNCFVDGGRVDGLAIADCAVRSDVEEDWSACRAGRSSSGEGRERDSRSGQTNTAKLEHFTTSKVEGVHSPVMLTGKRSDQQV